MLSEHEKQGRRRFNYSTTGARTGSGRSGIATRRRFRRGFCASAPRVKPARDNHGRAQFAYLWNHVLHPRSWAISTSTASRRHAAARARPPPACALVSAA
jgi:hypothetical protein